MRGPAPQLLTVEAAAERLAVSPSFVRRLLADGELAHAKLGPVTSKQAPVRIPENALAEYVRRMTIPAKEG